MSGDGHEVEVANSRDRGRSDLRDERRWPDPVDIDTRIKGFFDFPSEEQKSLLDYFYGILNRKWTVLAVFLVGLAVAGFVVYTSVPYYISRATIEINRLYPSASTMREAIDFFGQGDLYFQTQIHTLTSRGLAAKFLQRMASERSQDPGNEETAAGKTVSEPTKPETNDPAKDSGQSKQLAEERNKTASINAVLGRLRVTPLKGTRMINVTMGASDPVMAREMLDVYLKTFIELSDKKRDQLGSKMRQWLKDELAQAEKRLKASELDLLEFSRKHDIIVLGKNPNPKIGEFEKAGQEWIRSKSERVKLEALRYEKERTLPAHVSDEYLHSLKTKLAALKSEYAGMEGIYSPDYFKMALLRNKIKAVEKAIGEIQQNVLSSELGAAKKKEAHSREAYEKAKKEAIGMNSLAVKYGILKKAVEANEKLYLMLLQRSKQAEMDHGSMGYQIVMTSPPTLPLAPIKPRKGRIMFIGALLGLVGGIVLAFCLDLIDNTVQSTQEIQERLNLPILGAVPVLERGKTGKVGEDETTGIEFTAYRFPASPFTDAVRIVQNAASAFMPEDSGCSMLVTSALPLEGKTLISVVMGTVIASEKKKALIIDGDMRNPRIHQVFQSLPGDVGLSDLLTGKAVKLREAIRQSHVPGLYYMPAGFYPQNPVALLKNNRIQDILDACKKVFDAVIVDAPPLLGLVDARILADFADGLILVTRAGHTPVAVLREAKEAVYQGKGRLLGIVLNMADYKKGYGHGSGYYGSRYYNRYYRRYYHQHQRNMEAPEGNGDNRAVDV